MNILVISQYYYPEDFRINDICEELVRRGHKVSVVAGIPNYPKGEILEGYEKSYKKIEIRKGVKIYRCHNRPRKHGSINLIRNYISYARVANKVLSKIDDFFDLIYVYQLSPITLALPAIKYKKNHHIPIVMYVCDIWPESVREISSDRLLSLNNPIYLAFKRLSKKIYRSVDLLLLKCDEFGDYLREELNIQNKMMTIYEHAEQNYLSIALNEHTCDCINFMFLGNIGYGSNCQSIIRAASLLKDNKPYLIHFVGDGADYANVQNLCKSLNLEDKIIFHGRFPQTEMSRFYNIANVCLLTLSSKTKTGLTPPAKLLSYMAAAKPIIASIDGAAKAIIEKSQCGYVVPANDIEGFAHLMQMVIDNPDILNGLGKNGRQFFIDNFTLQEHANHLEKAMYSLLNNTNINKED